MYASYVNYFNLLTPITTLLLGVLLIACWTFVRSQVELLWIAAGYIMPSTILAAQSNMNNDGLARWTLLTTPLFIVSAWCIGNGIAIRYKTKSYPHLALIICLCGTALLYYFSRVEPNLWLRIILLNSAILMAQVLALPSALKSPSATTSWDRLFLWSFVLFSLLIFCRIIVVLSSDPATNTDLLTESRYWRFLLISSLFFSIWFIAILLGTTISEIFRCLKHDRDHDPLTGLLNRRAFFEETQKHLTKRGHGPATILTVDIDRFKSVNDMFGHDVGDAVLVGVAKSLSDEIGNRHIIARFGGEEFVVLLRECLPYQASELARNVQSRISQLSFHSGPTGVTASFGIAAVDDAEGLSDALKRADHALFRAKRNGRNQVQLAVAG